MENLVIWLFFGSIELNLLCNISLQNLRVKKLFVRQKMNKFNNCVIFLWFYLHRLDKKL